MQQINLKEIDEEENLRRMRKGDLYYAFTPSLVADRRRCRLASEEFNKAGDVSRRRLVEIQDDKSPLPPAAPTPEEDEDLLAKYVWCDGPIKMDYGRNVTLVLACTRPVSQDELTSTRFGDNTYVNSNSTWIDTCPINVGSRILIGPNCSFFSGSHPVDPFVRNGYNGPEMGAPITIEDDCWIGGNVTVLAGVTIGRGSTVGAGSVVTKDVAPYTVVVGNPARFLKAAVPPQAAEKGSGTAGAESA
ncbi:galactoside O-acetyltransferase [Apiospora marii]|uniref:Galactoside O-acetyltransferase n=1 Tax=Apiospora marii TaxID=335849 RepID=A0ABR1SEW9_9PEZI